MNLRMTNIGPIVGICITAAVLSACGAASRKAGFIAHGQQYFARGRYDKASVEFRNAAQIDPKDAQVRYLLGQVAEKTGDIRAAAGQYQSAILNDPKLETARAALGRIYLYAGAPRQAEELVRTGLKDAPQDAGLYTVLAGAEQRLGDRKAALKDAQTGLQLAPTDPFAIAVVTSVYRAQGQSDQAIATVQAGLKRLPGNVDLMVILADLYLQAQRPKDAEATLQQIVSAAPKDLSQRYRLARFYASQKNLDAAETTLRQAVAVEPSDLGAKAELLSFLLAERGRDRAAAEASALLAHSPDNDDLRNTVAQFLAQAGMAAEAETQYRSVIGHAGRKPAGLQARDGLAALRLKGKDLAGASTLIAQVLQANPADNAALVLRSTLESQKGDYSAAIADLRAVLKDQPDAVPLMSALADAYARNGEPDLAEDTLRTAVQLTPGDTNARLQLAQILLSDHKEDQAGRLLEQLAQESTSNVTIAEALFRAELQQKQIDKARTTAAAIEKMQPKLALGYYLAALADESGNKLDIAEREYRQALALDPDAAEPASGLMRLYMRRNQPKEALQVMQTQIDRSPHNGIARALKGELLESQGQTDAALAAYQDATAAAPAWGAGYERLAAAQIRAKHEDEAARTLQRGLAATDSPALAGDLAALYEHQGHIDAAIAVYDGVLAKTPNSVFAMNNLAMLLVNDRTDAASLTRAQKLAEQLIGTSLANVVDTRGWIKFKGGDYHGAEALLQQAVDKSPQDPLLRYHLAMAQLRSGESRIAQQNLESALQTTKPFDGIDQARATLAQLRKASPAG
jgi:tetratricopeptide (TPR) repeat protein